MSSQLGPIDVVCDAPPYHIVQACYRIGIEGAEDVRWCRVGSVTGGGGGWRQLIAFPPWNAFTRPQQTGEHNCSCGHNLPRLEAYTFTLITGKEISYLLGQCPRCHTVYWDDA
jgi:hypothetical protein